MHVGVNTLSVVVGSGGGATYLTGLMRELPKLDPSVQYTLFVSEANRGLLTEVPGRVSVRVVLGGIGRRLFRVAFEHTRLPRLIERSKVDVLFSPGNIALRVKSCAQVVSMQSFLYALAPKETGRLRRLYFSRMMPWSARRADAVIAVSEDARRRVLEFGRVAESKVRVIYHGVDAVFGRPPEGAIREELHRDGLEPGFILFVSTLKPYKNADKLIRALGHLRAMWGHEQQLVIVGRDPLRLTPALQKLARRLDVGGAVRFMGPVDHARLPFYYAGAAVFVFPSAIETFGLPVLEAMACGTPVIGSNRTSTPEIIGDAGLTCDPDDTPALAGYMREVLRSAALRAALVQKGRERARLFTWERAARQTLEVFHDAYRRWRKR